MFNEYYRDTAAMRCTWMIIVHLGHPTTSLYCLMLNATVHRIWKGAQIRLFMAINVQILFYFDSDRLMQTIDGNMRTLLPARAKNIFQHIIYFKKITRWNKFRLPVASRGSIGPQQKMASVPGIWSLARTSQTQQWSGTYWPTNPSVTGLTIFLPWG